MALSEELEELRLRVISSENQNADLKIKLDDLKQQNFDLQYKSTNEPRLLDLDDNNSNDNNSKEQLENLHAELLKKDQQIEDLNKQMVFLFIQLFKIDY